jgi:ABC-2 type transport system ATP-binding protein
MCGKGHGDIDERIDLRLPKDGEQRMNAILNQDSVVTVRELSKYFSGRRVLDNISLQVKPGSILGLIGPNGAGKSTLLNCMLGLLRPEMGEARVFATPSLQLKDTHKSALSYVPQRPDSLAWMTVGSMLDFVGSLYPAWDAALVQRLLQHWKLDANRGLSKLSPGERQQVELIRALAARPRLLILDEPAAALDPLARRELLKEIIECASGQGATVIFSTHIISDLERIATHIAFLNQGRLCLNSHLDALKDDLRRASVPSGVQLPDLPLPGELTRHQLNDGSWHLVLKMSEYADHNLLMHAKFDAISLEDLFVELAA